MTRFNYVDTSSWEDWQKEYKYGAFFIFPPKDIADQVDELRKKYDPKSAAYCSAHISLSDPLSGSLTEIQLEELQNALSLMEAFEIHYGPLRIFPPYPGVTYAISPEERFMDLRSAIHSTSIFKDVTLKKKDIAPHMTIAEFITMEKTYELLKELSGHVPEGDFICDSIEYAIPNQNFYFEQVLSIPLGNS